MDHLHVMEVSVPQQKMALFREGKLVKTYPADPTGLNRRMDPKILHRLGLTDGEMSVGFAPF